MELRKLADSAEAKSPSDRDFLENFSLAMGSMQYCEGEPDELSGDGFFRRMFDAGDLNGYDEDKKQLYRENVMNEFKAKMTLIVTGIAAAEDIPEYSLAIGIVYLVLAGVIIIPVVYLKRMLDSLRVAFRTDEDAPLEDSLKNFKSCLKFYGIMEIVVIALAIVACIVGIIVAVVAAVA